MAKKTRTVKQLYKVVGSPTENEEVLEKLTFEELKLLAENPNEAGEWTVADLDLVQHTQARRITGELLEVFRPYNMSVKAIHGYLEQCAHVVMEKVPIIEEPKKR